MATEQELFELKPIRPIKGFPELHWTGKRPYVSTQYFPAQLKECYGEEQNGWINKLYWGDNLWVMSHLLKEFRGKIDLIYIDPPFDDKADYKKKIEIRGQKAESDSTSFEEKQYGDIWTNDEYLQFMFERLIIMRDLLSDTGSIYLHCDWHKSHHLRMLMDEIFGVDKFCSEIIWKYSWGVRTDKIWNKKHDNILMYSKKTELIFNANEVLEEREISEATSNRLKYKGALITDGNKGRGTEEKALPTDVWYIATINGMASERQNYPTQKPEELLSKIIKASSDQGDLIFDCFMGSGTTQAVAMKLGRRFIGADINLGAIQTTTKRLLGIKKELENSLETEDKKYTSFEVYNVNNYDFFRNPLEAKDMLIEALEIQKYDKDSIYDGEKDGRMVKIMPINRIASKADISSFVSTLPYKMFEKRKNDNPNEPVEKFTIVCMGHEPGLKAELQKELSDYKVDIEIVDILRDKSMLELKREAEADVQRKGDKLIIKKFYPMNLMQKLSLDRKTVSDWKELVDSVMIDFNYAGAEIEPSVIDIPEKNKFVKGEYDIPKDAGRIKVKITDLLSESLEIILE
jgi:DNA modification methylase